MSASKWRPTTQRHTHTPNPPATSIVPIVPTHANSHLTNGRQQHTYPMHTPRGQQIDRHPGHLSPAILHQGVLHLTVGGSSCSSRGHVHSTTSCSTLSPVNRSSSSNKRRFQQHPAEHTTAGRGQGHTHTHTRLHSRLLVAASRAPARRCNLAPPAGVVTGQQDPAHTPAP